MLRELGKGREHGRASRKRVQALCKKQNILLAVAAGPKRITFSTCWERLLFTKSVDQKVRFGQLSSLCPWKRKEALMDRQSAADFPLLTRACQGDRQAMAILIEFC